MRSPCAAVDRRSLAPWPDAACAVSSGSRSGASGGVAGWLLDWLQDWRVAGVGVNVSREGGLGLAASMLDCRSLVPCSSRTLRLADAVASGRACVRPRCPDRLEGGRCAAVRVWIIARAARSGARTPQTESPARGADPRQRASADKNRAGTPIAVDPTARAYSPAAIRLRTLLAAVATIANIATVATASPPSLQACGPRGSATALERLVPEVDSRGHYGPSEQTRGLVDVQGLLHADILDSLLVKPTVFADGSGPAVGVSEPSRSHEVVPTLHAAVKNCRPLAPP